MSAILLLALPYLTPLLGGTALGAVLNILTPARLKMAIRVIKLGSGMFRLNEDEKQWIHERKEAERANPQMYIHSLGQWP